MRTISRLLPAALVASALLFAGSVRAEAFGMEARLAPWGGQGEVMPPADAATATIQMAGLRDELDRLEWVADAGGFPAIPAAQPLDLGVVDPAVEALRLRLTLGNDLPEALNWPAGSLEARTYDFDVLQAVQRFQLRHGLEPTGGVDSATLATLNQPVDTWISQINASLCAWERAGGNAPAEALEGVVIYTAPGPISHACADAAPAQSGLLVATSARAR